MGGAPPVSKGEHLLLYLHSSRQSIKVAWTTPVLFPTGEHHRRSSLSTEEPAPPSGVLESAGVHVVQSSKPVLSSQTAAPRPSAVVEGSSSRSWDEICCGVVFLRRTEICLPGLQVVVVRDGMKMVSAGEIIGKENLRALTQPPKKRTKKTRRRRKDGEDGDHDESEARKSGGGGDHAVSGVLKKAARRGGGAAALEVREAK